MIYEGSGNCWFNADIDVKDAYIEHNDCLSGVLTTQE